MAKVLTRVGGNASDPTWANDDPTTANKVLSQSLNGGNLFWEAGARNRKVLSQSGSNIVWASNVTSGNTVVIATITGRNASVGGSSQYYYFNGTDVIEASSANTANGYYLQLHNDSGDMVRIKKTFVCIKGIGIVGYSMGVVMPQDYNGGGELIEIYIRNPAGTAQSISNCQAVSSTKMYGGEVSANSISLSSAINNFGGCSRGHQVAFHGVLASAAIPGLTREYLSGSGPQSGIVAAVSNQGLIQTTTAPTAPDGYIAVRPKDTFLVSCLYYGGIPIALMCLDKGSDVSVVNPYGYLNIGTPIVEISTVLDYTPDGARMYYSGGNESEMWDYSQYHNEIVIGVQI